MADEWNTKRISDLGKVITGKTPSTKVSGYFGGDYPFITIPDLYGRRDISTSARTLSKLGADSMHTCQLPPGTVMMSCIATIGKCGITTRPSFTNQQINSVVCNKDVDPIFLYYAFTQLASALDAAGGGGSVYTNVSKSRFSDIKVLIPPFKEQQAIACILGALDNKIELNRQMNRTLEETARAIFKSWFVDFDPVRAKAAGQRPSGLKSEIAALFPDSFENSDLGEIPKGWKVGLLQDLGNVICGKTPPTADKNNYGSDVPFITIPDMHGKIYVTKTEKALSNKGATTQKNKFIPPFSICVSCIATPGLVTLTSTHCQTNQQINSIIPSDPNTSLYCYFALRELGEQIRAHGAGGSVLLNLNKGQFSSLKKMLPPKEESKAFQNVTLPIFARILNNENECGTLAALRDTLLPKLISGELRVADVESIVGRCL